MAASNLHVYPAPIVNESRIFKQTASIAGAELFERVIICGTARADLPRVEELDARRRIERVGAPLDGRPGSVLARVSGQIRWSRDVYRTFRDSDITVVNAHSVAVLPVCYFLARRLGARLIYDTHELETKTVGARGLQGRIFGAIERALINRVDALVVVNQSIGEWYRERYPRLRPIVVRNIPGTQVQTEPVDMRTRLGVPEGRRLFIHTGNLAPGRNIESMLTAFTAAGVEDHLVLLGAGSLAPLVDDYAARHSNIHHMPPVPPASVLAHVAGCDAALCLTQLTCLSNQLALPNKAFEYALAGVPFLFTNMVEVVRMLGAGFERWKMDDVDRDLPTALATLTDDDIARARSELESLRLPTWEEEAQEMIAVYRRLLPVPDPV